MVVFLGAVDVFDVDSLLNADGVLVRGADARRLDSGFVDVDGFLEHGGAAVVVVAVNNSLVYADGLFEGGGGSAVGSVDGGLVYADALFDRGLGFAVRGVDSAFVDTDGLLEGGPVVMVVVAAVNNSFGCVNVLTVSWLVASTVFTLDLVDGAEVLVVLVVVRVMRVMVVGPVSVDFNPRANVG